MAYYCLVEEGSEEAALRHLENALACSRRPGRVFSHVLFVEAASASAAIRRRADQARIWRDRAYKLHRAKRITQSLLEAEIATCEGRYEEAVTHWQAVWADVAKRKLDSGMLRFAKEKWAEREAECRAALARVV